MFPAGLSTKSNFTKWTSKLNCGDEGQQRSGVRGEKLSKRAKQLQGRVLMVDRCPAFIWRWKRASVDLPWNLKPRKQLKAFRKCGEARAKTKNNGKPLHKKMKNGNSFSTEEKSGNCYTILWTIYPTLLIRHETKLVSASFVCVRGSLWWYLLL